MKNLKKLSRNELKCVAGGLLAPSANDCHVHYKVNSDGSLGPIVSSGSGACHPVPGTTCRTFSSGSDGSCY